MSVKERFLGELKKIDVAKLTSDMVKIKSYSFMKDQEKEIAEYVYKFFKGEGIEANKYEIEPGRFNVVARIPGVGKKAGDKGTGAGTGAKSLMLSGHMDTVPAYDMKNPFSGDIRDGKVFGRGACDMKGPLASMMAALAAIKRAGIELEGDLYFAGLADEEEQGKGAKYLVEHGPIATGTIMGEPSSLDMALGHKGLEWIRVTIKGKKVHGGDVEHGVNAIQMAARYINKIYEEYVPVLSEREYPLLGKPTINIGTINGGDQPSTFPGECEIRLDRRCVPTETIEQVYKELEGIAEELHKQDSRFNAKVEDIFAGEELLPHLPFCTSQSDALVQSVQKAKASAKNPGDHQGELSPVIAFPAWTDAGFIAAGTDSSCIVMGPGELGLAHSTSECVAIKELEEAAYIYGMTAIDYCR